LDLSLGGSGRGGGGGSVAAAGVEGWLDEGTMLPSFDAFKFAELPPRGVIAFVEGAAVAVGPAAAAAFSPSLLSFTSAGSTNSAVNSRPPCGGHWRLYRALRVAVASSIDAYWTRTDTSH
jgi:hypothetical protein